MPDITMCSNKTCPLRPRCYRALARPDPLQSYSYFQPRFPPGAVVDQCDHFVPIKPTDVLERP